MSDNSVTIQHAKEYLASLTAFRFYKAYIPKTLAGDFACDLFHLLMDKQDKIIRLNERVKQLEQENEWISVDDGLPEDGDYSVMVAFTNGAVEDMKMVHVQDWVRDGGYCDLKVTHWHRFAPSPIKPKEG